jgi:hypothetical protein
MTVTQPSGARNHVRLQWSPVHWVKNPTGYSAEVGPLIPKAGISFRKQITLVRTIYHHRFFTKVMIVEFRRSPFSLQLALES